MTILSFLAISIMAASSAAWLITLGYKWGVIEWVQVNAPWDIVSKMFSCGFCLSWWTCVLIAIAAWIITDDSILLLIPFVSTKLCQCLIK